MNDISLLIKPAGALCPLDCTYCFYKQNSVNGIGSHGIMKEETVSVLLNRVFSLKPKSVSFSFQGGEPTLAGKDWFRRFLSLLSTESEPGTRVSLSIQTNGMLLDEEWAELFKEYGFLVGLSLDGDRKTNDRCRIDKEGKGVFDRTVFAAELLSDHHVDFNILSVLTDKSALEAEKTYKFFKNQGFRFLQFIPLVENGSGEELGSEAYAFFLKRIFDLWYDDFERGEYVSIRHIDNYIRILLGDEPENCAMCGVCGRYFVIESDGSVFPCDFYCLDEYKTASVFDKAPFGMNEKHLEFLKDSTLIHAFCESCRFAFLCRGGCRRDRFEGLTKNKYCSAYLDFFEYSFERMANVARRFSLRP